jgi:preprotein translocase subunit SecY
MSILIFTSVISRLPFEGTAVLRQGTPVQFGAIVLLGLAIIVAVVFMEQGQRRIPVQYAKRIVGRRMTSGGSTYIPLKVNQAGVIPIIFASSVLYFPTLLGSLVPWQGFENFVNNVLLNQGHVVYIVLYTLMVIFFAYFYTAITFNPIDVADNMKKYGGFIPGIRPGQKTAEELDRVITRLTLPGSLYLATLAILPLLALGVAGVQFPFAGATLLIVVGVGLETMKQIESQMMQRHYEGFLRR